MFITMYKHLDNCKERKWNYCSISFWVELYSFSCRNCVWCDHWLDVPCSHQSVTVSLPHCVLYNIWFVALRSKTTEDEVYGDVSRCNGCRTAKVTQRNKRSRKQMKGQKEFRYLVVTSRTIGRSTLATVTMTIPAHCNSFSIASVGKEYQNIIYHRVREFVVTCNYLWAESAG